MPDYQFHHKTAPKSLAELAKISGATLRGGDPNTIISDVASLGEATPGEISFLDNIKYKDAFLKTQASAFLVSEKLADLAPKGCAVLVTETPYKAYALIAQAFYPDAMPQAEISKQALIDPTAKIGEGCRIEAGAVIGNSVEIGAGCWIGANSVIGDGVKIGTKTRIGANASLSHALIGAGCRIYPGVRIGQDGFGFAMDPAGFVKVPQLGRVVIGDHVEIGANSCIDRGAGPDTVIGDGTWIDNLVQIGHNVKVGKGCVIIAQAGIAGSTVLEDYVVLAAQGGIAGHLHIGKGSRIAAQSGIMRDLPAGSEVMGSPAVPIKQAMRQVTALKKLTEDKKKG